MEADDIDKLERTGVETVFVIEVEKQNQEVDLYYSADGTLIKSIVDTDDDNSEHLPVQLTEAMKNFINEKYPNARIMEVDVEDDRNDWDFGFTEVDIIHNGISKDVLFNQTGNWYSTSWEIRQNELPEAVNNTLNNQYGEYRFDEAKRIEKADGTIYYRIELEKMKAVLYTLAFKFLNKKELAEVKEVIAMTELGKMLVNDGFEKGLAEGKAEVEAKFVAIIRKKRAKGLDASAVAEELELETAYVEKVMALIAEGPSVSDLQIAQMILGQ